MKNNLAFMSSISRNKKETVKTIDHNQDYCRWVSISLGSKRRIISRVLPRTPLPVN